MKAGKSRGSSSILTPSLTVRWRSSRTEPQQFLIFNPSSASAQSSLHPDTTRHTGGLKPTDWLTDWLTDQVSSFTNRPMWELLQSIFYQEPRKLSLSISSEWANHLFADILFYNSGSARRAVSGPFSPHPDPAWSVEIGLFDFLSLEYCKMSDVEAVCQTWRPRQDSAGMLINS